MKGIYYKNGSLSLRKDLIKPNQIAGQSIIKITNAAICNTDKEIVKGYKPDFEGVLGHEFVGIVESSDVPSLIGKRVVGELNEGCGSCLYCRTDREKHCEERKVIGIHNKWGCFAEYMQIASHLLHIVPDELPTEKAIFTEPLAAALEITSSIHIKPNQPIAILGDGKLAYMIVQVISLIGAEVTVFGKSIDKLEPFKKYANTANSLSNSFETVIDVTGSPTGLDSALKLVRKRGTIVLKSTYAEPKSLDMSQFVVNEIRLIGTRCGPFKPAINLLKRQLIDLPSIEFFSIDDYQQAFEYRGFKAGFRI